ncbi:MAG: VOC family protein [Candidatus Thorarchaeota archaeon]|nr:VOC family protein [Candidatus Thorarchaeota archaeon]
MGRVVHFEIVADDADRISNFYKTVFGWKVQKWDGPTDYWFLTTGDEKESGIDGAFGIRQSEDDAVVNTIDVSSIDETVKQIEENGGLIVRPKSVIPGVGYLAYFKDTEGNLWGIMQSDANAK